MATSTIKADIKPSAVHAEIQNGFPRSGVTYDTVSRTAAKHLGWLT